MWNVRKNLTLPLNALPGMQGGFIWSLLFLLFLVVRYVAVTMQVWIHRASLMTKELPSLPFILKLIVSSYILMYS